MCMAGSCCVSRIHAAAKGRHTCRARSEGALPAVTGRSLVRSGRGCMQPVTPEGCAGVESLCCCACLSTGSWDAIWLKRREPRSIFLSAKAVRAQWSRTHVAHPLPFGAMELGEHSWRASYVMGQLTPAAACHMAHPTEPLLTLAWNRSDALATRRPHPSRRSPGP